MLNFVSDAFNFIFGNYFTFKFATLPLGWYYWYYCATIILINAVHVILNCFTCKLVFSPVNRTSFYLDIAVSIVSIAVGLIIEGRRWGMG